MNRCIQRRYEFTNREVREILIGWMKQNDLPCPAYIGDAETTKWTVAPDGIIVEWSDADQVGVPDGKPVT